MNPIKTTRGFFANATLLLLFGLLMLSLSQSSARQQLTSSSQSNSYGLAKANAIASEVAFGMGQFLPEISRAADGSLIIGSNAASPADMQSYSAYRALVSKNLSKMLNADIELPEKPVLLVGDKAIGDGGASIPTEEAKSGVFVQVKVKVGNTQISKVRIG